MKLEQIKKLIERKTDCQTLEKRTKKGGLAILRGMFMKLARDHTDYSYTKIGNTVKRDHTTAMYWDRNLHDIIRFDKPLKTLYKDLESEIIELKNTNLIALFDKEAQTVINSMV